MNRAGQRHGHRGEWLWLALHDSGDDAGLAFAVEGHAAGEHFVEHAAEGEDVAARVGILAFELLGRHVLECPEHRASLGQRLTRLRFRRKPRHARGGILSCRLELREAEVEELRA